MDHAIAFAKNVLLESGFVQQMVFALKTAFGKIDAFQRLYDKKNVSCSCGLQNYRMLLL